MTVTEQPKPWTATSFRRYSVDIHVPDWHPDLLGRFDAAAHVDCMARAGVQALNHYANSHAGLCLWPTNVGKRHANMGDRDFFGEVVNECRRRGIHPVGYFSVIFDNWAFETHPQWRIVRVDGYEGQLQGRYGLVCPNSGYRDYVLACIKEIATGYDIAGMFFDMTFWPGVCYCPHCTERFWREHHAEPPRIVDWDDPTWRAFQAARERWLLEFTTTITDAVRRYRPGATASTQFSTIFHNWTMGVPLELAQASDYVGGDFYGSPAQHSLACKVYHGLSRTRPFEFRTSRTRNARDHVTVKPMEEVRTEAFVATLHSAALTLIDYINADGTLKRDVYDFLGQLSAQRAVYEPFLGGDLVADIAIYLDKASLYNPDEQGIHIGKLQSPDHCPHRDAVVGAARMLQEAHIAFGVVTNANLDQLSRYRGVMLPSVLEMTTEQADRFRQFVEGGGVLYASGGSSLDRRAPGGPRFLLEDVLGVRYLGATGGRISYLTPHDAGLLAAIWPQDHLSVSDLAVTASGVDRRSSANAGRLVRVSAFPEVAVLATATLPFVDPEEGTVIGSRFAAIHSNPPALESGTDPAVVVHSFGKGRAVWVAAPIESNPEQVNAVFVLALLRRVIPGRLRVEVEAPSVVEVTVFEQPERQRLLVGLLNLQQQRPQVPVGAMLRVQLVKGKAATQLLRLPEEERVPFTADGEAVRFVIPHFDGLAMFAVEYA